MKKTIKFDNRIADPTFFLKPLKSIRYVPLSQQIGFFIIITTAREVFGAMSSVLLLESGHISLTSIESGLSGSGNMAISLYLFAILFCHLISLFDSNEEFFKYCIQIFMKGTDDIATSSVWMVNKITSKKK